MYMPGRLRTASSPSSTLIESAPYPSELCLFAIGKSAELTPTEASTSIIIVGRSDIRVNKAAAHQTRSIKHYFTCEFSSRLHTVYGMNLLLKTCPNPVLEAAAQRTIL